MCRPGAINRKSPNLRRGLFLHIESLTNEIIFSLFDRIAPAQEIGRDGISARRCRTREVGIKTTIAPIVSERASTDRIIGTS